MKEKIIRVGIIILTIYLVVSFIRDSMELSRVEERLKRAQEEVETLRTERQELEKKKEWVEGEGFVEEQARNKLDMAKEGEAVVILPESTGNLEIGGVENKQGKGEVQENWKRWWFLFF